MRHHRDYADVSGPDPRYPKPSNIGFLGVPRMGSGLGVATILLALLLAGIFLGSGFKGISWPLG